MRQSWQHISFASDCTAIELRRASDRSRVAILADGPVGATSARRPQKAVAERLTIMACQRSPLDTPEELDVCTSPSCPAIWVGYQWGMRRRRCFFFSEFTIPVAQKASWLLGLERAYYCLVWPGTSARRVAFTQFRICWAGLLGHLGSLALFLSRRFCILLYYDLLQAGLGERSWRHYRV